MNLRDTPNAVRLHVGIFGKRNSGKSTLLDAITKQKVSTASPMAGTTTDPVVKTMELHGLGPVVFYDTADFDDEGELGNLRVERTVEVAQRTDMATLVPRDMDIPWEMTRCKELKEKRIPALCTWSQDVEDERVYADIVTQIEKKTGSDVLTTSVKESVTGDVCQALIRLLPSDFAGETITGHLVQEDDLVLFVMSQDIQAPEGRLILPQVQTIRDLLGRKCIIQSCINDTLNTAFSALSEPPRLIITNSQAFPLVYEKKPEGGLLTSFSALFAKYRGDIQYFIKNAKAIDQLIVNSRILITKACIHAPFAEDIGRVKTPAMLKKKYGDGSQMDIVSSMGFPKELQNYDFIIHCGARMFSKKYI